CGTLMPSFDTRGRPRRFAHASHQNNLRRKAWLCACGCGTTVKKTSRWAPGHWRLPTLEERFWAKVHKRGPHDCWLWTSLRDPDGYGLISVNSRGRRATWVSWLIHDGLWPAGQLVCHACDTPACVNPHHLWLGTATDNNRDTIAKGRFRTAHGKKRNVIAK